MKTTGKMIVMAIALLTAGNVLAATAQEAGVNLVIHNLNKGEITNLVIEASSKKLPKNKSCKALENIQINEGAVYGVSLPDSMTKIDMFDIEIAVDGKRFKTEKGVMIDFSKGKIPTLFLSTEEETLLSGLGNIAPSVITASVLGIATTKSILPRTALNVGMKAGLIALGPKGWIFLGGLLLVEGGIIVYDKFFAPGDLFIQVDYN